MEWSGLGRLAEEVGELLRDLDGLFDQAEVCADCEFERAGCGMEEGRDVPNDSPKLTVVNSRMTSESWPSATLPITSTYPEAGRTVS